MQNIFTQVYYLKRSVLLYQFATGHYPRLKDLVIGQIEDEDTFFSVVGDVLESINQQILGYTNDHLALLQKYNCTNLVELAECCDFDVITDKHHHRKFFNEIENDEIVEFFIEKLFSILDLSEEGNYIISIYDFNNYDICFPTLAELETFVQKYDVVPYTAYELVNGHCVELYSE